MINIDNILCPLDFSIYSRRALDYAIGIARWYGARITALHVSAVDVPVGEITPFAGTPSVHTSGIGGPALRGLLDEFVDAERAEGVVIETDVVAGPVAREVAVQAQLRAADLIVMGTHGRSGFQRLILGSVAERVLRSAPCAVLTVPAAAPEAVPVLPGLFRSILCPTDFSEAATRSLRWGLAFAEEADAELLVLHVFEHLMTGHDAFPRSALAAYKREYQQWATARLRDAVPEAARTWCSVQELTRSGSAHDEIVAVAAERKCDLIVMGVGRTRHLSDRVFGSTTQQVVRAASSPVLTVREE